MLFSSLVVIDVLEIKSCTGNKISKGESESIRSMHEEISAEDSGSPTKVRGNDAKNNIRKKSVQRKWRTREIEIKGNSEK